MNALGVASYVACAISFAALTLLLAISWRGRRQGVLIIAAAATTTLWAALLAAQQFRPDVPVLAVFIAESARNCAWLLALVSIAGAAAPRALALLVRVLCIVLVAVAVGAPLLERSGVLLMSPTALFARAGLGVSVIGLILLEQIYRNSSQHARTALKFFTIGAGAMFAYDLVLYSQAELLGGLSLEMWNARGALSALAAPLIAVAARRNPAWSLDIFVSRQAVFYTTTFLIVGAYLIVAAVGGYYVKEFGGAWGGVGQVVFVAGACIALVSLIASRTLRRHAQVLINKHFYRNKYDYRIEWLRFIGTLSSTGERDVRRTAIRAVAQIFNSPGGILLSYQEAMDKFAPSAAWPMRLEDAPGAIDVPRSHDLAGFLERTRWIIDTRELRRTPDVYGDLVLPQWLDSDPQLRIIAPLIQENRLTGFVVLYDPPPPFDLTYEDRDLLKTVGRHVATHLAQQDADRKLAEARQFEAYSRLTAFMMHDLKNSAAQLRLIVDNAERHKRNPAFVDDAIDTIANAAERISGLIEQLQGSSHPQRLTTVSLAAAARQAIKHCAARSPAPTLQTSDATVAVDASNDRLVAVIEHLIRNAQDATPESGVVTVQVDRTSQNAVLSVTDSGEGMDAEFIRDRLFRPFDSTKGSKGMGIGAYQVREYVVTLGGTLEVQSTPGRGTRFVISLPLSSQRAAVAVAQAG